VFSSNLLKPAALAAAMALVAGTAGAATYNLTFTGIVANGSYSSQDIGGSHYDQFVLSLEGFDPMEPITLADGDIVNATINLDEDFTIPASVDFTAVVFVLGNSSAFPSGDVNTSGTTDFFLDGGLVKTNTTSTGTSGQIAASAFFGVPDNGLFTFDSLLTSFTIDDLSAPVTVDYALLSYTRADLVDAPTGGVPEPSSWALMILGFGGMGAALRARRRQLA